jgi:hypothetical protein
VGVGEGAGEEAKGVSVVSWAMLSVMWFSCSLSIATSLSISSLALRGLRWGGVASGEEGREEQAEETEEEEDEEERDSWSWWRERRGEVGGVHSFLRVVCTSSSCSSSELVVFHPRYVERRG